MRCWCVLWQYWFCWHTWCCKLITMTYIYVYMSIWGENVTREVGQSCCDGLKLRCDIFLSTARQTLCEVIGFNKGHSFSKKLDKRITSSVPFVCLRTIVALPELLERFSFLAVRNFDDFQCINLRCNANNVYLFRGVIIRDYMDFNCHFKLLIGSPWHVIACNFGIKLSGTLAKCSSRLFWCCLQLFLVYDFLTFWVRFWTDIQDPSTLLRKRISYVYILHICSLVDTSLLHTDIFIGYHSLQKF